MASFEGGILTLTLSDGSTVTGKVSERTEIKCDRRGASAHAADHGGGDESDASGDGSRDEPASRDKADEREAEQSDEDEHGEEAAHAACGISSLVPGAAVREAELRVSSTGATFVDIELLG